MADEVRRQLPDEVVDQLLALTEEEIVEHGGLLSHSTQQLVESVVATALSEPARPEGSVEIHTSSDNRGAASCLILRA